MDPVIEYLFGPGDGSTTTWTSVADADLNHDGIPDAVLLDFDGDGRRDDAMWDTDGDGVADVSVLDLDDDGEYDAFFRDGGKGLWDRRVEREELDTGPRQPPPRHPPPGQPPPSSPDTGADLDTDGDGQVDARLEGPAGSGRITPDRLYVDVDGDGHFDHVLVDLDGDGRADACYDSRDPRFRP